MNESIKQEYDYLLKSGMFWVFLPQLTGTWEDDMAEFIEYYVTKCKRDNGEIGI